MAVQRNMRTRRTDRHTRSSRPTGLTRAALRGFGVAADMEQIAARMLQPAPRR